jgi:predicted amidohydrolase
MLQAGSLTRQQVADRAVALAEEAGRDGADIVCLPEALGSVGAPGRPDALVARSEFIPGGTTRRLARVARKYGMYVICPIVERAAGAFYNTAVVLGRRGEVAGTFRKQVPTPEELALGILPGAAPRALATDVGRIGVAICFDLNFRDIEDGWRRQNADLLFWPSAFEGGVLLEQWARYCNAYVVASTWGETASVYDKTGQALATATWRSPVVTATLNLDRRLYHWDTARNCVPALKRKYGAEVSVEHLSPWARVAITSHRRGLSLARLEREFEFERIDAYLDRARALRDRIAAPRRGV